MVARPAARLRPAPPAILGAYFALSQILRGGNLVGSLFLLVRGAFWTRGGLFAASATIAYRAAGAARGEE